MRMAFPKKRIDSLLNHVKKWSSGRQNTLPARQISKSASKKNGTRLVQQVVRETIMVH